MGKTPGASKIKRENRKYCRVEWKDHKGAVHFVESLLKARIDVLTKNLRGLMIPFQLTFHTVKDNPEFMQGFTSNFSTDADFALSYR